MESNESHTFALALGALRDIDVLSPESQRAAQVLAARVDEERGHASSTGSRARKVSVSMPEELSAAVQERVGRGGFSRYVTEAVAKQLELDLLAELSVLLEEEHGPVPEDALAEAEAAWPDAD
ncbi:hypothetical protein [Allosalinactinospora lopnorensis]|uniref:hypothetical protein n=1 Tax=Allosalinactinospora lopnorensis TaxID=1352348 RepID=UPI00191BDBBD|nr:hypothetical protein [Allosalinactinospora lopnorensis]